MKTGLVLREGFGFLEEGDGELGLDGRDDGVAEFQQVGGGLGVLVYQH
jgi:hypothetical protein